MHCLSRSLHGSVSEKKDERAFWDVIEILGHHNIKLINKHSVDSMRGKLLKGQKLLIGLSALYDACRLEVVDAGRWDRFTCRGVQTAA
eukprot:1662388-Amphidinium_carterae.1